MNTLALGLAVATSVWGGDKLEDVTCARPIQPRCYRRFMKARREDRALKAWKRHRRAATADYQGWLLSTRTCESHGNYRTNTGNGFYGAYQFVPSTWWSVGGVGMPHLNPPLEQDYRAVKLMLSGGTGHWPVCG
jgi:Transglycosylase-like domain